MREKKRLNRLKVKAVIAESYEAAMYWRLRREVHIQTVPSCEFLTSSNVPLQKVPQLVAPSQNIPSHQTLV
jgi:hypothetical protein